MYRIENLEMQEDNKTRKIIREYPEYDHDSSDLTDSSEDYLGEKRPTDKSKESFEDLSEGSDSSERYISLSYNVIDMIRLAIAACLSFGLTYLMYYTSVYSVIILCTILITTMISIELGNDQYNDYSLNIPRND